MRRTIEKVRTLFPNIALHLGWWAAVALVVLRITGTISAPAGLLAVLMMGVAFFGALSLSRRQLTDVVIRSIEAGYNLRENKERNNHHDS